MTDWPSTFQAIQRVLANRQSFRGLPEHLLRQLCARILVCRLSRQQLVTVFEWGLGRELRFGDSDEDALRHAKWIHCSLSDAGSIDGKPVLLLTDTHAAINGIAADEYAPYMGDVRKAAGTMGFDSLTMSGLLDGVLGHDWRTFRDRLVPREEAWARLSASMQAELERRASRCCGVRPPLHAAKEYVQVCEIEGLAVCARYPLGITVTYHTPNFRFLAPPMPVIHAFVRPGRIVQRPWFRNSGSP